jgi:hypothetical protein
VKKVVARLVLILLLYIVGVSELFNKIEASDILLFCVGVTFGVDLYARYGQCCLLAITMQLFLL